MCAARGVLMDSCSVLPPRMRERPPVAASRDRGDGRPRSAPVWRRPRCRFLVDYTPDSTRFTSRAQRSSVSCWMCTIASPSR